MSTNFNDCLKEIHTFYEKSNLNYIFKYHYFKDYVLFEQHKPFNDFILIIIIIIIIKGLLRYPELT